MKRQLLNWSSLSLCFFVYFTINSCSKATTEFPAYLKCDSTKLISTQYGEPNSSIYGLQMSVGTDDRGTWQLPFKMPILKEGINPIFFTPIVKVNDLSTLFIAYPFYKSKNVYLNLEKNKIIDTIIPFEYQDSLTMLIHENMEVKTNFNNTNIDPNARNGNYSMVIKANNSTSDSTTTSFYYKPLNFNLNLTNYYLELDYTMSQGALGFGLAYTDNSGNINIAIMGNSLLPTMNWKHVYIDLKPMLSRVSATQYTPVFILISTNGASQATAYIDNIKILVK
jgi:hypothetical protein